MTTQSNKTKYGDFYCDFCDKHFTSLAGKNGHQPYCCNNPNKRDAWNKGLDKSHPTVAKYSENMTNTKNTKEYKDAHPVWNKGLTAEKDERVKKNTENTRKTITTVEHKKKVKERIVDKYGKHFTQTETYKIDRQQNHLEKYGVEHPLQRTEVFEKVQKRRYKRYNVNLPSGNTVKVQGYERFAIPYLLQTYLETDICVGAKNIPKVVYTVGTNTKVYYPDLFIRSINTVVEVKSLYTVMSNIAINTLKYRETIKTYNYICLIFDRDGSLLFEIDNLEEFYDKHK